MKFFGLKKKLKKVQRRDKNGDGTSKNSSDNQGKSTTTTANETNKGPATKVEPEETSGNKTLENSSDNNGKTATRTANESNEVPDKKVELEEKSSSSERQSRSVNDFESDGDLRQALLTNTKGSFHDMLETGCSLSNRDVMKQLAHSDSALFDNHQMKDVDQKLDWVLENYDKQTTVPQSLDHELRRLLVLKSYLVLDTERRELFEKVTKTASRLFSCPIALISLVDLGRQWFLSNRGLGDVRETPRKLAFCAHAIMSKKDALIVLDATKDDRFKDSPLVTGPPDIRFYAGAPLLSPEGYKLGTLCVIDRKARSLFTEEEEANLIDLAAMAVQALVTHKRMKTVWFNNLKKTRFPTLGANGDNAEYSAKQVSTVASHDEEKYEEDQDVAVFLEKTKHMPLSSFLSVLENQAKELNLSPEYLKKYEALAESNPSSTAKPLKEKVRFVKDRKKCYEVHDVECWKSIKDLWWSSEETNDIQVEAFSTTLFYRKHRPQYAQSVEIIATSIEPKKAVQDHMMKMLADGKARGLESQIVSLLSGNRKETVQAVLQKQSECLKTGDSNVMERLRSQSLLHSQLSTRFAERTAQCDHISAMKATMSQWRAKAAPRLPQKFAKIA